MQSPYHSNRAAPRSLNRALRGSIRELRGWWWLLPLAWVATPSRFPPRQGLVSIKNRVLNIRLRSGGQIRLKAKEFNGVLDVFCLEDYDFPEIKWDESKSVVDIGASIGLFMLWHSRLNQHARYLAIEPSKEMIQLLEHNVEVNQLGERVSTMNAAVGASDGLAKIEVDERTGMAQLASLGCTSSEVVLSISFAGVIEKCGGQVDLMKIDCEGAEYEFFGAALDADLVKCASIVGEYHPAPASVQDSLFKDLARGGFQFKKVVIESTPSGELGLFCAWRD